MVELTKKDILNGIDKPERHEIKSLNGELWLRKLSSSELDEINHIELKGFGKIEQSSRGKTNNPSEELLQVNKTNVLEVIKGQDQAKYEIVYKSLNNKKYEDDPFKLQDIKKFSSEAINEISAIVKDISGYNLTPGAVKRFPQDKSR